MIAATNVSTMIPSRQLYGCALNDVAVVVDKKPSMREPCLLVGPMENLSHCPIEWQ